jgi:hypothetical protein
MQLNTVDLFEKNKYVFIKNFLDKHKCEDLSQSLQTIVDSGKYRKDEQCPLSPAVKDTVVFDTLLQDVLPQVENYVGKKLLPTYAYARLYNPNDELKKHKDRPACEISATLTLGFEGDPWPIYMASNKIDMQVGDAVIYRGMEIEHWREPYKEGKWQAQVFLHYVDAEGLHTDQKYDGRSSLNLNNIKNEVVHDFWVHKKVLSEQFCNRLIETYSNQDIPKEKPYLGHSESTFSLNETIRKVERIVLPSDTGVGATLSSKGLNTNNDTWKFNITHSIQTEFLIYKPGGHYVAHTDSNFYIDGPMRKLTCLAFLNNDYEGGEFFIQASKEKRYINAEPGDIIIFPSFLLHGVEPVKKG